MWRRRGGETPVIGPAPALLRGLSWQSLLFALVITLATVAVREWMGDPPAGSSAGFLTPSLLAVTASALMAGPLAGLVSTVVSAAASLYFFLEPVHSWRIESPYDAVQLATLILVGISISWLAAVFRAALRYQTVTAERLARRESEIRATLNVLQRRVRQGNIELENREVEMVNLAAALRDSEERFRLIFDGSPEAMFLVDPHDPSGDWPIVEANEAACRMNGYARGEIIGRPIDVVNARKDTPEGRAAFLKSLREEGPQRLRVLHVRKDGSTFPVESSNSIVHLGGRELALGVDRDVTERERHESALQHQAAALAAANRELAARNAEQETFLYTVSHDLRTPLLAIRGMAGVLSEAVEEGNQSDVEHALGRINGNVDRMTGLLDDLIAFSQSGHAEGEEQKAALDQVFEAVRTEVEVALASAGAVIEPPAAWPCVAVAPSDAYQVLSVLLGNAVKFSQRAGRTPHVLLAWTRDGRTITLRVSDNGPGVPPAYRERVFGLFQRLEPSSEGTGVGLAIVKRVAERYRGRAWIEDSPYGGATVAVTLPVA